MTHTLNIPRRCRAFRADGLQCEGEFTALAAHVEDHWATSANGHTARWTDEEAVDATGLHRFRDKRPPASAKQVGGDHYKQTAIQPWDIIDDHGLDFYRGNALKYLLRAGKKGPAVQDLRKALHYIEKCIEREEGK